MSGFKGAGQSKVARKLHARFDAEADHLSQPSPSGMSAVAIARAAAARKSAAKQGRGARWGIDRTPSRGGGNQRMVTLGDTDEGEILKKVIEESKRMHDEEQRRSSSGAGAVASPAANAFWACEACTFHNSRTRKRCQVCATKKPARPVGVPAEPAAVGRQQGYEHGDRAHDEPTGGRGAAAASQPGIGCRIQPTDSAGTGSRDVPRDGGACRCDSGSASAGCAPSPGGQRRWQRSRQLPWRERAGQRGRGGGSVAAA